MRNSDRTKGELVFSANVRIVGDIRQGESVVALTQTAPALKAEKEGVEAVMRGTPDSVRFPLKVPLATGQSVSMGGGGGALSADNYNELDLRVPLKI